MKPLTTLVLLLIWVGFCWVMFSGFSVPFPRIATGAGAVVLTWATRGWVFNRLTAWRER
jgi:hypothetical protein